MSSVRLEGSGGAPPRRAWRRDPRGAGRRANRFRPAPSADAATLPLAGIRVLDVTHAWAGPFAGLQLGFLGADMIKVEGARRPDGTRYVSRDDAQSLAAARDRRLFPRMEPQQALGRDQHGRRRRPRVDARSDPTQRRPHQQLLGAGAAEMGPRLAGAARAQPTARARHHAGLRLARSLSRVRRLWRDDRRRRRPRAALGLRGRKADPLRRRLSRSAGRPLRRARGRCSACSIASRPAKGCGSTSRIRNACCT